MYIHFDLFQVLATVIRYFFSHPRFKLPLIFVTGACSHFCYKRFWKQEDWWVCCKADGMASIFSPWSEKNLALRYFTFVCNSVYLPHLINNLCYSNSFGNAGVTFLIHVQCSSNTTDSSKHTIRKHVTFNHILNSVWHLYAHWPVLLTNKPILTIYNKCTSKCLLNCSLKMAL